MNDHCDYILKMINSSDHYQTYQQELSGMISSLKTHQQLMNEGKRQLLPKLRTRRGAFNFLGQIIKAISGNLDSEDAERYDEAIEQLKQNQEKIIKTNTLQISLSQKALEETKQNVENLQKNQITLKSRLIQLGSAIKNISLYNIETKRKTDLYGMIFTIISGIEAINQVLDKMIIAKTFAKINIYHPTVMSTDILLSELLNIKENIKPERLPLPVTDDNIYAIEKAIKIKAYRKSTKIRFLLEIPLCEPTPYQYYKLYPIPLLMNSTFQTLKIRNPYLAENNDRYISMVTKCKEIQQETYLCEETSVDINMDTPCEYQLLKHERRNNTCTHEVTTRIPQTLIKITENEWLFQTNTPEKITTKCNQKEEDRVLTGNYLFQISEECSIRWKQELMTTHTRRLPDRTFHMANINLSDIPEELPHWKFEDVKLQQNQWKNFETSQVMMKTLQQDMEEIQGIQWHTTTGLSSIIPCIILAAMALYLFRRYRRSSQTLNKEDSREQPKTQDAVEDTRHPWLRSSNQEGRSYE